MSRKQKSSSVDLQRFWRGTIRKWRKSGLSTRQFCKSQNLSESSFYFWRKKSANTKLADTSKRKGKATSGFIEVSIPDGNPFTLELVLTSGNILKIGSSVDNNILKNVLSAMKEAGLC